MSDNQDAAVDTDQINSTIRYAMFSVFRVDNNRASEAESASRAVQADEVEELFEKLRAGRVTIRGTYDVSALRADADLLIWWHAPTADELQDAYNAFRRTRFGRQLIPVWSNAGLHRPAEFNRSHVPAFMANETPGRYLCVYPFVRSYEWYLLPEEERRFLLREHGLAARDYADVRANTVSSFALGDYEWLLAFEAEELHRIVDLMRELRATGARRHVREELPFFTGRSLPIRQIIELLP